MKARDQFISILISAAVMFLFLAVAGSAAPLQAQSIQVLSANPPTAEQGTVNLTVLIKGKGFKRGALAKFLVTGTTDTGGVTVNSTSYVSATDLTANINVADTAVLSKFDIQVMNSDGRGGKGTELFAVTAKVVGKQNSCLALTPVLTSATSCTSPLPGCLDTTFGTGGVAITNTTGSAPLIQDLDEAKAGVFMQGDGKIVAVGISLDPSATTFPNTVFTAIRYNPDGTLDPTFGTGGVSKLPFHAEGNAAALQADGKILEVGFAVNGVKSNTGMAVARWNADGTPDSTFGSGGTLVINFGSRSQYGGDAWGVTVQPDGKILVAGMVGTSGAVIRLTPSGALDTSFGSGGVVTVAAGVFAVAVQTLISGTTTEQRIVGAGDGLSVFRLTLNGALDTTFGPSHTGAASAYYCGNRDMFTAITFDAANNIVAAGIMSTSDNRANINHFGLARFTANGIVDTGFGDLVPNSSQRKGTTAVSFFGGWGRAWGVGVQTDGKIAVSGYERNPDPFGNYFALARYNADGTLDTSFGTGGVVATDFGVDPSQDASSFRLLLQPDGKIVLAGSAQANGGYNFAVARYWP